VTPEKRANGFADWHDILYRSWQFLVFCSNSHLKVFMGSAIHLSDGSVLALLDREHWSSLASQECDCQTKTGRLITARIAALKHTDGRVVVFATVQDGLKTTAAGGELLTSIDRQLVEGALGRLAEQFSRGPFMLKQCLAQMNSLAV
jgi:hypothetical protein